MDFKVADLRKKLNKLKFTASTKTDKLNALMKEYEKVVRLNAEMVSKITRGNTNGLLILISIKTLIGSFV
jgi:hypothetical protein